MKLTYEQIMLTVDAIKEVEKVQLPMRFAIRVARAMKSVREHAQQFEDTRQEIIRRYLVDNKVPEDKLDEVNAEILAAASEEVEIDFNPINVAEITSEVSIGMLERTMWMWTIDQ